MNDILIGLAIALGLGAWFMLVTAVALRGDADGPRCPGRWGQQGELCPHCRTRRQRTLARRSHG